MGSLAALASAATFAMNLVLARVVYDAGGNLFAINLIRPFAFLACVLLVLRIAGRPIALPPGRRWASAGVGLLLTAELYAILGAIKFIPVSLAVLINYCYPLLIALFTWSMGRERATVPKALCLLAAFGGLALALIGNGGGQEPLGLLFAAVSALVMATMLITSEHTMAGADRRVVMVYMLCVCCAAVTLISLTLVQPVWPEGWLGWAAFAGSTICFVAATFLLFTAVDLIGPLRTAVIDNSSPVWAILFAGLLLGEALSARQWLGAGAVIAAVLALQLLQGRDAPGTARRKAARP